MKFLVGYYWKIVMQWGQSTFNGGICVGGGLLRGILASEGDFPQMHSLIACGFTSYKPFITSKEFQLHRDEVFDK